VVDWRFVAGCLTLEHRLPRIETRSVLRCGVRASDFRCWQILLQKSPVTDDVVWPFHLGRRGLVPDPDALATLTLRNTQSLSGWRSRNQIRERDGKFAHL
jgi:hypothetical protein